MSWRKLSVLVRMMPRDGTALAREIGGKPAEWSAREYMLARLVEATELTAWAYLSVHQSKGAKPLERPSPVGRPGDQPARKQRRKASHDETVAFFAAAMTGGGERG